MDTITITYNSERRKLVFFRNGKMVAGMVGQIAEQRYHAIKHEYEQTDLLNKINHGHKAKTPEV
ncbi:MAG: hypothetical protein JXB49_32335 [Bacteroidales bacterium]|nr:hypothetical protein [Bacteroidales bacterium]